MFFSDSYNQYQHMKGVNKCLEDSTPLLNILSFSTDGESGPDLLYTVISDIVSNCTEIIIILLIDCNT